MAEHDRDRSVDTDDGDRGDTQHGEAHVRHGRVGDQLLEVGLGEGDGRSVDDRDHRQHGEEPLPCGETGRQDRQRHPKEAVGAHLQQRTGKNGRCRRRRLDVGVGKPGVQGPDRHLDRETEEEQQEEPPLQPRGQQVPDGGKTNHVERAGLEVERDDADQHEHRAEQRVEEELHRRVLTSGTAPLGDQEVHGDEHELPEHVEQYEVESQEDAVGAYLQQEQHREVELRLGLDLPRRDDREKRQQSREDQHRQGDTVDCHRVVDVDLGDPRDLLGELATATRHEGVDNPRDQGQVDRRKRRGDPTWPLRSALGQQRDRSRSEQWQKHNEGQHASGPFHHDVDHYTDHESDNSREHQPLVALDTTGLELAESRARLSG